MNHKTVRLILPNGEEFPLPMIESTAGPDVVDITTLYSKAGIFAYDPGFQSTASCKSAITYVDGDAGILRYRGYNIEALINEPFASIAYLLLHGELPDKNQGAAFAKELKYHSMVHEQLVNVLSGFPRRSHPMAIMVGCAASLSAFYHEELGVYDNDARALTAVRVIAKIPTLVAMIHKYSIGQPIVYPDNDLCYVSSFLRMMFAVPTEKYVPNPVFVDAMSKILFLHADHEQNASTSTVRLCGSTGANPFACIASGVAALWGPAHGGANEAVIKQLKIIGDKRKVPDFIKRSKDPAEGFRLMGFGHRVYKNFDPRAKVLKEICASVLDSCENKESRELLGIATELERIALQDEYFISRKLYPNVDFYSGIILEAMGIPTRMFTPIFALGRATGWIAQWAEMCSESLKIGRPRQLYVGRGER
jgi:citrate synthase